MNFFEIKKIRDLLEYMVHATYQYPDPACEQSMDEINRPEYIDQCLEWVNENADEMATAIVGARGVPKVPGTHQ